MGFCIYVPDLNNGLAGMGIFSPQFQPSSFDGLLLISIFNIIKLIDKPNHSFDKASILLPCVVAVLIHPSLVVSACIVLIASLSSTSNVLERIRIMKFSVLNTLLVLTVILLPYFLRSISIESLIYSKPEIEAFDFLAYSRIPYHAVPTNFMDFTDALRVMTILIGTLIVYRSKKLSTSLRIFTLLISQYSRIFQSVLPLLISQYSY